MLMYAFYLRFGGKTPRLGESLDQGLWVLVNVVVEGRKAADACIIQEAPFLEEEGQILLATDLFALSAFVISRPPFSGQPT